MAQPKRSRTAKRQHGQFLTPLATRILKTVGNHTRNIQGKDIERLPYPEWVGANTRREAISRLRLFVEQAERGVRLYAHGWLRECSRNGNAAKPVRRN